MIAILYPFMIAMHSNWFYAHRDNHYELMEEDGRQFRNYVKYNAVLAVIMIAIIAIMDGTGCSLSECSQLFSLELFDCYAVHAKLLLWMLMKNVVVVIADSILYTGQVE